MRISKITICLIALFSLAFPCNKAAAQSSSLPMTLGVRLGVNSANQGINLNELFSDVKKGNTEWRTGIDIGVVADLSLGRYIALQPGFFYQNHSYDYVVASANFDKRTLSESFGHARFYSFQVPMLVSFRLPMGNKIQWQIDAGPYLSFGIGGNNEIESYQSSITDGGAIAMKQYKTGFYDDSNGDIVGNKKFDWGFKLGSGILYRSHYYFGIHYSAGCRNVGKAHSAFLAKPSVKNKSWDFSIGYNF